MVGALCVSVDDLGRFLAGDSTALCARGKKPASVEVSHSGQKTVRLPVIDQPESHGQGMEDGLPGPTGRAIACGIRRAGFGTGSACFVRSACV